MTLLQRDKEKFNEGRAEGRAEGKLEQLIELVKENIISIAVAALKAGMTEDEFRSLLK